MLAFQKRLSTNCRVIPKAEAFQVFLTRNASAPSPSSWSFIDFPDRAARNGRLPEFHLFDLHKGSVGSTFPLPFFVSVKFRLIFYAASWLDLANYGSVGEGSAGEWVQTSLVAI